MNRREFFIACGGSLAAAGLFVAGEERAWAFAQSQSLAKFIQPLPGLGANGIRVAAPTADPVFGTGVDYYELAAGQYTQLLHPNLPKATRLWGYADITGGKPANFRHLGPIIVARRNRPVRIRMTNTLPPNHILPVDTTIMGAAGAQNRIAVHLHGGFVPWVSDGGPFSYFDPTGIDIGASFLPYAVAPTLPPVPGQADYFYPNQQSARLMWYHDHALGTTRLNAYAGLASGYVLRDYAVEMAAGLALIEKGGREVPLIVQDKIFVSSTTAVTDPTWKWGAPGDLWYPHVYERNRWKSQSSATGGQTPPPNPSVIPEMFGDTMLMNGVAYPSVTLEPTVYRFRVLNACQARFLNLQLFKQDASVDGITLGANGLPTNPAGPPIVQIGTEADFLPAPVVLNAPPLPINLVTNTGNLLLAPAERADLLIDFSKLPAGTKLILYNDAPAPFPMGAPVNDYYPGAPKNPTVTTPGSGPNTRQLMQFVVGSLVGPPTPPVNFGALTMDPAPLVPVGVTTLPPGGSGPAVDTQRDV